MTWRDVVGLIATMTLVSSTVRPPNARAVAFLACVSLLLAGRCDAQQQQLPRPGAGLPTFGPPAESAPPQDVREKTDALMKSVSPNQPGVLTTKVHTTLVTVEAIDPATRVVTLRGEDGVVSQANVAPDVDLSQVKVGDHVSIKEIASVAVFISRRVLAKPPAAPSVVVETSAPGEKPARVRVETEEIAATVAAIDHSTHTATLRNPDGSLRTIQVDPRVDLEEIDVGDQVTLRLTKALALSVERPH